MRNYKIPNLGHATLHPFKKKFKIGCGGGGKLDMKNTKKIPFIFVLGSAKRPFRKLFLGFLLKSHRCQEHLKRPLMLEANAKHFFPLNEQNRLLRAKSKIPHS